MSHTRQAEAYDKKSALWNAEAGVRSSAEEFDLNQCLTHEEFSAKEWHLPDYSGILRHPRLAELSPEQKKFVMGLQLLEFVTKQAIFEIECVNNVASKLAFGGFDFQLSESLRLDALKVYTDEGYHSYYTQKLSNQIRRHYGVEEAEIERQVAVFFDKIRHLKNSYEPQHSDLVMFALVVVAECQVVADISEEMKGLVYEPIKNLFRDHMRDEVFHAMFFSNVFEAVWTQLEGQQQEVVGKAIADAIPILGLPRTETYFYSLAKAGLSRTAIKRCIADIYGTKEWSSEKLIKRMAPTLSLLKKSNVFSNSSVHAIFQRRGFI